jgi:3-methyladenine DNA glycosylase AlkD
MTLKQTLAALEKAGTAQNRKVYGRHGVTGDMFGVSYAELGRLKKKIKVDHDLALGLWASGNHDARVLACMVADPAAFKARELDGMARELGNYVITDAFGTMVAHGPLARGRADVWKNRKNEWVSCAGWNVLGSLALNDDDLDDRYCADQIAIIAKEIHTRPNRTRHSMNNALIALGVRNGKLEKKARAAAKKIGKVEVDHGETGCQTPDADSYMTKTLTHRKKKKRC